MNAQNSSSPMTYPTNNHSQSPIICVDNHPTKQTWTSSPTTYSQQYSSPKLYPNTIFKQSSSKQGGQL